MSRSVTQSCRITSRCRGASTAASPLLRPPERRRSADPSPGAPVMASLADATLASHIFNTMGVTADDIEDMS